MVPECFSNWVTNAWKLMFRARAISLAVLRDGCLLPENSMDRWDMLMPVRRAMILRLMNLSQKSTLCGVGFRSIHLLGDP